MRRQPLRRWWRDNAQYALLYVAGLVLLVVLVIAGVLFLAGGLHAGVKSS